MELALGVVLLVYGLFDLLFRWMGLLAYARGSRRSPRIALTFDDGPSERTLELLALLRRHGVRATFFLTGERAERLPHLVQALRAEGHQVEGHGYGHNPLLLFLPWYEWRHIQRSPGRYYRPPHGLHTPFTRPFCWLLGKRVALWDTEGQDWLDRPPEVLAERILFYLRPGSILLLHDGPERTLRLLESLLPRLLALGYQPVTLDELDPIPLSPRLALIRALQGLEERYNRRHKVERVGLGPFHLLRVEKKPFPGPSLPGLPQGSLVYELHLESERAMELSTFEAIRHFRQSFQALAQKVAQDPGVQGVYGYTPLALGGEFFGFETHPLPFPQGLLPSLAGAWFRWLYRGEAEWRPAEVIWLDREGLLRKWPPSRPASKGPAETPP